MSANTESLAKENTEFHSRVPPSEPLTTKGHAPGVKVGNDAVPEFHAQTFPAGTAPAENTFQPNVRPEDTPSQRTGAAASDTLIGATSADVHQGLGHPGSGQTSQELHDGSKRRAGLEGVGANLTDPVREQRADVSVPPGARGKSGNAADIPGAENIQGETAETVAAERP
ncbi:hypothetical protein B0T11DRAFT_340963 [Plectosphaerella cucumerina]|uniref:Uncharacterized protein n=1 Tax=Plectosphaerella cucumerina TaxID=40658 RepID=A0A8K0TFR9_9PEZI|nr:hypothetical protein B0T11DRAFT_340963 [Plectosphaerella cucumerina]